jgi:hypothetical protein
MPNTKTNYDKLWFDTWLEKTNKKYWIYNFIDYQPEHIFYKHGMLASSWACRKLDGENKIFSYKKFMDFFINKMVNIFVFERFSLSRLHI